jgi:hypothetical protein
MAQHMDVTRGFVMIDNDMIIKPVVTQTKTITLQGVNISYTFSVSEQDELIIAKVDQNGTSTIVGKFK